MSYCNPSVDLDVPSRLLRRRVPSDAPRPAVERPAASSSAAVGELGGRRDFDGSGAAGGVLSHTSARDSCHIRMPKSLSILLRAISGAG